MLKHLQTGGGMVSTYTPHAKSEESQVKRLCKSVSNYNEAMASSHRYSAQRTEQAICKCQHQSLLNSLVPLLTFITSVVEHFGASVTDNKAGFKSTISTLNSVTAALNTPCSAALRGKARRRGVYRDKLRTQTYTSIHSHTYTHTQNVWKFYKS